MLMRTGIRTEWVARRRSFDHDWLINEYWRRLPSGSTFAELAKKRVVSEVSARDLEAAITLVRAWEGHEEEGKWVVENFGDQMSPKNLLDLCAPLRGLRAEDRAWMGKVLDAVWRSRYSVKKWTSDTKRCLKNVQKTYRALLGVMQSVDKDDSAALLALDERFEDLRNACSTLSTAMRAFPDEVWL